MNDFEDTGIGAINTPFQNPPDADGIPFGITVDDVLSTKWERLECVPLPVTNPQLAEGYSGFCRGQRIFFGIHNDGHTAVMVYETGTDFMTMILPNLPEDDALFNAVRSSSASARGRVPSPRAERRAERMTAIRSLRMKRRRNRQ